MLVILEDLQWAGSESLTPAGAPRRARGRAAAALRGELPRRRARRPAARAARAAACSSWAGSPARASPRSPPRCWASAGRRPEVIDRLRARDGGQPVLPRRGGARARRGGGRALPRGHRADAGDGSPRATCTSSCGGASSSVPRRARPLLEAAAVIGRQIDLRAAPPPGRPAPTSRRGSAPAPTWPCSTSQRGRLPLRPRQAARGPARRRSPEARRDAAPPGGRGDRGRVRRTRPSRRWRSPTTGRAAGDVAKEARYSALAGEQALQSSAYHEAAALLRARDRPSCPLPGAGAADRDAAERTGPRPRAIRARSEPLVPLRPGCVDSERRPLPPRPVGGPPLRGLRAACRTTPRPSATASRRSAHLGRPMPSGRAGLVAGLPVAGRAARARVALARRLRRGIGATAARVLLEATRIQTRDDRGTASTPRSRCPLLWSGLSMLNLGEPAGPSASLACGYALMAAVAGIIPLHPMAEAWSRRALELVEAVGKPYDVAFVLAAGGALPAVDGAVGRGRGRASRAASRSPARRRSAAPRRRDELPRHDGLIYQGRFVHAEESFSEMTRVDGPHRRTRSSSAAGGSSAPASSSAAASTPRRSR